jgi:phage host-nuclease inhibitor protein Gam
MFEANDTETMFEADDTTDAPEAATSGGDRFTIDSEEKANWLLNKLAAIEEEAARVKSQARKRAEELEADRNRLMGRFGAELEAFARTLAQERRRKSVTLLAGTLAFRTVPARWTITDEDAALQAAGNLDVCVTTRVTKVTLDKAALFDYLDATGDLLPGIERTEAGESFCVRFPKAGKGGEEE